MTQTEDDRPFGGPDDARDAAAALIRAIKAKDPSGVDNALRLHYAACQPDAVAAVNPRRAKPNVDFADRRDDHG